MHPSASRLQRLAPAKINLALHVVGRRNDGYHLLESLVAFTRFGDQVSAKLSEQTTLQASGPYGETLPLDNTNLILRAERLLREKLASQAVKPVSFTLEKNLPIASGIGGGSSDAAAAIALLCRLWNVDLTLDELVPLTLPLGADVPMCLAARPLIARGTGEQIEPIRLPSLPMVLVNPGIPLSTPAVFKALEIRDNGSLPLFNDMRDMAALIEWLKHARNDLETPATTIVPEIKTALESLTIEGAQISRMSGSGATCFGIFLKQQDATQAAHAIAQRHPTWFAVATHTFASDEAIDEHP